MFLNELAKLGVIFPTLTQWQVKGVFFQARSRCFGVILQLILPCLGVVCKSRLHGWEASFMGTFPRAYNPKSHRSTPYNLYYALL